VAGAGILGTSDNAPAAGEFLDFLLSEEAQQYFANETFEYPLVEGVPINEELVPLSEIETPNIDLSNLDDLEGTLELLRETGVL
jgi:iron(III) transport system substrate-binding protein